MKLIGRSLVQSHDWSRSAKQRLALWCLEIKAANWESFEDIQNQYPKSQCLESGEVCFAFPSVGVNVVTRLAYNARVVAITSVEYEKDN
jgi:mRNA-degrading endonuclease HigB of HigAB toxin-antitoxin module